jgi:hypothetical protein
MAPGHHVAVNEVFMEAQVPNGERRILGLSRVVDVRRISQHGGKHGQIWWPLFRNGFSETRLQEGALETRKAWKQVVGKSCLTL